MLKIACFCLAIATATQVWSQVAPSASGGGSSLDDSEMSTPPPVSGNAYPSGIGSESRSNYLAGGLVVTAAYQDNLLLASNNGPISDETYSFVPTIGFDRKTPRQSESLGYSSGFTLYQNTSQLNSVTQNASGGYRFRLSPYAVVVLSDSFWQNNNLYNESNPFTGGGVSGGPGASNAVVISPFENLIANSTSAGLHYQYARNAMIGGSGSYSFQQFSGSANVSGLNNEGTAGVSGFFSRRLSRSQYVGASYQYSKFVTHPVNTYTLSQTVLGFYTFYFTQNFSCTIQGGPEYYTVWSNASPRQAAWTPAVQGSFGWQTLRTNLAASYSHTVSGAGGLIGTYHSDVVGVSGRFALSRTWNIGANVNYSRFNNVNSSPVVASGSGGNSIFGGVNLNHRITEKLNALIGYGHLHEYYAGIPSASTFPDSNRVNFSIMYGFNRPLGR